MAVSTTVTFSGPYEANGVTVAFPFDFVAASEAEVGAFIRDEDGVDAAISDSAFDVALTATGGTATFDEAPLGGLLYLYSRPDFKQQTGFDSGQKFQPAVVSRALDKAALRDLHLLDRTDRALTIPLGEIAVELPPAAARAGKALAFGPAGTPLLIDPDLGGGTATDDGEWAPGDPLVQPGGGWPEWFSMERVDPGKFGIIDSASIDQTAAMKALALFANAQPNGCAIHWGHRRVRVSDQIKFTKSVAFLGEGSGSSFIILDGVNAQIYCEYGDGADGDYTAKTPAMEKMSVVVGPDSVVTPFVVGIQSNTGGVSVGGIMRDCVVRGQDGDCGFPWAAEFAGCSNVHIDNVVVIGARSSNPLTGLGSIYCWAQEGQDKADLHVNRLISTFTRVGIKVRGHFEGVKVTASTFIASIYGIDWAADVGSVEPLLQAWDNHFNCERGAILLDGIVQYDIHNNNCYNQAVEALATDYVAFDVKQRTGQPMMSSIMANKFFLLGGTAASRTAVALRSDGSAPTNAIVDHNHCYGGGSGTTLGFYLDPNVVGAVIGSMNDFRGLTQDMDIQNANNTVHHLTSGGMLGLFREDPLAKLHVGGDIRTDGIFVMPGGIVVAQGAATPEGSFAAPPASLYLTPGATYRKATGTGNTGWVSLG